MKNDPIVISAFGAVTPIGGDYEEIKHSLINGVSGIREIEKFNCATFVTRHAGVPLEGNEPRRRNAADERPVELTYAGLAIDRLLASAPDLHRRYDAGRIGCSIGVDIPGADINRTLEIVGRLAGDQGRGAYIERLIQSYRVNDFLDLEPSFVLGEIHKRITFSGFTAIHAGLCSASLQSMGMGLRALRQGRVDAVIAGGISGKVNPFNLARLEALDVISTDPHLSPQYRSRPFDKRRSGFVPAEGGILFLMERESAVLKDRLRPLVRILGYGASMAAEHIVIPHTSSLEMELAMRRALADAHTRPDEIEMINAHGTSTVLNDRHESQAIQTIFGEKTSIPVTANKSMHGHLIASAGAMEVLNTIISLRESFVPPTINLDDKSLDCDVNVCREIRRIPLKKALKNSFGMGGLAASMVLEGWPR